MKPLVAGRPNEARPPIVMQTATPGILFHRGLGRYMYLPAPEANGGIEVVVEPAGEMEAGATPRPLEEPPSEAAEPQPRLFEIG